MQAYLDNSATTKPLEEVIDLMADVARNYYGNPSSLHMKGIEAERLIRKAREGIATSLSVDPREITFVSGGTEANNLAIRGYLEANPRKGNHIITTTIEHPSVLEVFRYLSQTGWKVDYIPVDTQGVVDLEQLKACITENTSLISVMMVNNELGTIQPIENIVRIRNTVNRETVIHVDAVQGYGKLPLQPRKLGVELMSISAHKIHGPKGMGACYSSKSLRLKPIFLGGGQEALLRSGTENVPGICGFGLAAETALREQAAAYRHVAELRSYFINLLQERIEDCRVNSSDAALPYVVNVSFPNVKSEVLLHHLEAKNVYVSTGSACSSRKNVHSHVLAAIGLEQCYIEGAVRFSFSRFNTHEEILYAVEMLRSILPQIRIKKGGRK